MGGCLNIVDGRHVGDGGDERTQAVEDPDDRKILMTAAAGLTKRYKQKSKRKARVLVPGEGGNMGGKTRRRRTRGSKKELKIIKSRDSNEKDRKRSETSTHATKRSVAGAGGKGR